MTICRLRKKLDSPAEIERASALIQSIFTIRAGDSGVLKLKLEPVSLIGLVKETIDLYGPAAEDHGLGFDLFVPTSEQPLTLDRQRIQQGLCNLLDNAINHTPINGKIELVLEFRDENAVISVRDTGPGLSKSDPDRIWRRFVRGSAASASTPGIGLGLSLVKAVTYAHGGTVGSLNREKEGAEFWIQIPIGRYSGRDESEKTALALHFHE